MPKKKKPNNEPEKDITDNVFIENAGDIREEIITDTLKTNYMPYAMSVILSRAIPEIDGLKPSHRKLLYTMYTMGLLKGGTVKSANIVGRTMQLNPHGDASIYDTMVRLSRGNETLLYPYVESKGNFGKAYSKNMMYAASRYTEAKLAPICKELFDDIDKNTVDFVDNYDATMKEPKLLPVKFPSILCNVTTGIAVGMASSICSFNLKEICETTIGLIRNKQFDLFETLIAPDFVGGGYIIYDRDELEKIYETGRGSVKVRAKYTYDKTYNCIEIKEIPPTTTSEAIIDKIIELVKANKIKEISDIRDETDLKGLKITIDLKRGVDYEHLMARLYSMTPLEESFSCNFNVLVDGVPKVRGVREILNLWIAFRFNCIKRRTEFELKKKRHQLHLLKGLSKILLDIDKAIKIIRETAKEVDVVPNLMIGFAIDKEQAEYVAEIKLRHINREYILNRIKDIENLENETAELEKTLSSTRRINNIIVSELEYIIKTYNKDRKSEILYNVSDNDELLAPEVASYPVNVFVTKGGYIKKIRSANMRLNGEQKLKEGDEIILETEVDNKDKIFFFTTKYQVYRACLDDLPDGRSSQMGDYIPAKFGFEEDEEFLLSAIYKDYSGFMIFLFENGKIAKINMSSFETKGNRKKLTNAFSSASTLIGALNIHEDSDIVIDISNGRKILLNTSLISPKTSKSSNGVQTVLLKKKTDKILSMHVFKKNEFEKAWRYRAKRLPSQGAPVSANDLKNSQIGFDDI